MDKQIIEDLEVVADESPALADTMHRAISEIDRLRERLGHMHQQHNAVAAQ